VKSHGQKGFFLGLPRNLSDLIVRAILNGGPC
jgi:hypothetical protein